MPDSLPASPPPANSSGHADAIEQGKAAWTSRIEQHIHSGEYARARELVKLALIEFPNDLGLRGLDSLAEHALRRTAEAAVLLREGLKLIEENRFDAGLEFLCRAERLDDRNAEIRAALVGALFSDYQQKQSPTTSATRTLQCVPPAPVAAGESPPLAPLPPTPDSKRRTPLFIDGAIGAIILTISVVLAFLALNHRKPHDRPAKPTAAQPASPAQTPSKAQNTIYRPGPTIPALLEPESTPAANGTAPAEVPANLPLIVTANVPNAVVVVNNRELKTRLKNGKLTIRRPPGKYRVLVKADDYNTTTVQIVELTAGAAVPWVNFTLTRVPHSATSGR